MMSHEVVLTHISAKPGVYKMLDAQGTVLYVGKALNLKKRVASYFTKTCDSVKTRALVSHIVSVDVTVTRTETEAFILESAWIKAYRPKYNILMRDDKSYPFIMFSDHPLFPTIAVVRRKKKPSSGHYFGPYPSTTAVRETMHMLHKLFKLRNCSDIYFNARSRPCLQYQIKRCSAPCTHFISAQAYQQSIQDAARFLQGKSAEVMTAMEARMQAAVNRLAYEEAAELRDQIKYLRTVQEQQHIVRSNRDADILVLLAQPGFACVQWVKVRQGAIVFSEHFLPSVPDNSLDEVEEDVLWQQVFSACVSQLYCDSPEQIPDLILTDRKPADKAMLEEALTQIRGKRCRIQMGQRGLSANWISFAHNNLQQAIIKHHTAIHTVQTRMQALAAFLQRDHPISKIECFDVSHFQGDSTVASCVVFDEEGPCKREYRRFNIQGIQRGDDYAAMEQALIRRYQKSDRYVPDVLIMDGGLGQIAVARRVLTMLGLERILILGVAKGPSRKSGWERLILAVDNTEQALAEHSPARHLIQYIRDEAHRFAITTHRKQRDKRSMQGSLESIPGLGPQRRKALLQRFGGLRELSKAPVDELVKVRGISQTLAKKIQAHFLEE